MKIVITFGMGIGIFLTAMLSGCGGASSSSGGSEPAALQTQAMVNGGGSHTLMVNADGTVLSWGDNSSLQLGNDSTASPDTPARPVLSDVTAVAAGGVHSLALKKDGTVWGWGGSRYGQAGDPRPVGVIQGPGSISIAIGGRVTPSIRLYDAGAAAGSTLQIDRPPKLGDISSPPPIVLPSPRIMSPRQISGLSDIVAVAAGSDHSLALKCDGTVWAWGRNSSGQLGVATTGEQSTYPVKASCPDGMIAIAAGAGHSVALRKDGTVWAWGDNTYGQTGGVTGGTTLSPRQVAGLEGVIAITSGGDHILALTRDGSLWGWGRNAHGQLGTNSTTDSIEPVRIPLPEPVLAMAGGGNHSVAVTSSGHVWVWGDNTAWQGGGESFEERILAPRVVAGVDSVKTVAAGEAHTLVGKRDGTFLGWGNNLSGQLGDGTRGYRRHPVMIAAVRTGHIIEGGDWGGRDLTPRDGDILSGTFTNVGRFVINNGDIVGYGPGDVTISATAIDIDGSVYGMSREISNLTISTSSASYRDGSALVPFSDGTLTVLVNTPCETLTTPIISRPDRSPQVSGPRRQAFCRTLRGAL